MDFNSYKDQDFQPQNFALEEDTNENEPIPLIDPNISSELKSKLSCGISVLYEVKKYFPNQIPILDMDFISTFMNYVKGENKDFLQLLDLFLTTNSESFLKFDIMAFLFSKAPFSLNQIYLILRNGGKDAFYEFDKECGFYMIASFSSEPPFKLVISEILELTILNIYDYTDLFQIPFSLADLDSESTVVYRDLSCTDLIKNLLDSADVNVIKNTLYALKIAFKRRTDACVILGHLFMNYFDNFIQNPDFGDETVITFSAGIKNIPMLDLKKVTNIAESLLTNKNEYLMGVGIKLILALLELNSSVEKVTTKETPIDIFNETRVFQSIFEITQNGPYKLKVAAYNAISEFVKFADFEHIQFFLDNGILALLNETFSDEPSDSSAEIELVLITIEILYRTLDKIIYYNIPRPLLQEMIQYYIYLGNLASNEDDRIAKKAQEAYLKLYSFYGCLSEKEDK